MTACSVKQAQYCVDTASITLASRMNFKSRRITTYNTHSRAAWRVKVIVSAIRWRVTCICTFAQSRPSLAVSSRQPSAIELQVWCPKNTAQCTHSDEIDLRTERHRRDL